jgi:hypothetical protein
MLVQYLRLPRRIGSQHDQRLRCNPVLLARTDFWDRQAAHGLRRRIGAAGRCIELESRGHGGGLAAQLDKRKVDKFAQPLDVRRKSLQNPQPR